MKNPVDYPVKFSIALESSIIYKKVHQDHIDSRVFFTPQDINFLRVDLSHFCEKNDVLALLFSCIILNSTSCTPTCRFSTFQPFLKKTGRLQKVGFQKYSPSDKGTLNLWLKNSMGGFI